MCWLGNNMLLYISPGRERIREDVRGRMSSKKYGRMSYSRQLTRKSKNSNIYAIFITRYTRYDAMCNVMNLPSKPIQLQNIFLWERWCDTILFSPFFDASLHHHYHYLPQKDVCRACAINMIPYFLLYSPLYYFCTLPSQLVACHVTLMIIISKWNQCLTVPIYLVNCFIFFLTFRNSMYVVGRKWQAERKKKAKQQYFFLFYLCPQLNAHCHQDQTTTSPAVKRSTSLW